MPQVILNAVCKVEIVESEKGWGRKIDEVVYFDNWEEAKEYVIKFNSQNPPGPVPDYYIQAEGPYKI